MVTVIILVGLTVILSTYLVMVRWQTRWNSDRYASEQALYLAEAGVNRAVWYLIHAAPDGSTDGSWRTAAYPAVSGPGVTDPQEETLADGTYTLWVESSGSQVVITARGEVGLLNRTVQQVVTLTLGTPNIVDPVPATWREL